MVSFDLNDRSADKETASVLPLAFGPLPLASRACDIDRRLPVDVPAVGEAKLFVVPGLPFAVLESGNAAIRSSNINAPLVPC